LLPTYSSLFFMVMFLSLLLPFFLSKMYRMVFLTISTYLGYNVQISNICLFRSTIGSDRAIFFNLSVRKRYFFTLQGNENNFFEYIVSGIKNPSFYTDFKNLYLSVHFLLRSNVEFSNYCKKRDVLIPIQPIWKEKKNHLIEGSKNNLNWTKR
jgi:hypothetical protein